MDKPYKLPDPEKQPDSFIVILYKTLKKVPYNDRQWDKHFFPRVIKRAQELLEIFNGDVRAAAACMQGLKARFEDQDTKWTIETVISYAFEWRSENGNVSDRDCLRDLIGAYSQSNLTGLIKAPDPERMLSKFKERVPPDSEVYDPTRDK